MASSPRHVLSPKSEGAPWLGISLGCGCLLLLALFLVPPAIFLLADEVPPQPEEPEPLATTPTPPPQPPPTQPAAPPGVPPNAPPPAGADANSRTVNVSVTEVTGLSTVQVGTTCSFPVSRVTRPDGTFWCNAQIRCGAELLYGGGQAGYFDCTLYEQPQRHVFGEDRNTTRSDRDAAMRLDTLREELEVRDDATGRLGAFTVRARVTSVR